jgi:hypothetical protein
MAGVEVAHRRPQHAVLAGRALEQLVIGGERHRHHHEEAAAGTVPGHVASRAEAPSEPVEDLPQVPLVGGRLPIVRRHQAAVVREQLPADDRLGDRGGVDGQHALYLGQLVGEQAHPAATAVDPLIGQDVPDAGAWKAGLGERAQVDHPAAGVEGLERREPRSVVEQAVRVVLEQQDLFPGGQVEQAVAEFDGHAHPGRVREVRHHVARPRAQPGVPGPAELAGQVVQVDAERPAAHRPDRHVRQPGRPGQPHVRRGDRQQDVSLVGPQRAQDHEHGLLAADGDHDRLGIDVDFLIAPELAGDQLMHDSLGPPVLEKSLIDFRLTEPSVILQVTTVSIDVIMDQLDVEKFLGRAPRGERDRLRVAAGDLVEEVHRLQGRIG